MKMRPERKKPTAGLYLKHTLGNWFLKYETEIASEIHHGQILGSTGQVEIHGGPSIPHSEKVANARLMSAASELLMALYNARTMLMACGMRVTRDGKIYPNDNPIMIEIQAAITKATGHLD